MSNEIHRAIAKHLDAGEVWEIRSFHGFTATGEIQVEILDPGIDGPARYKAVSFTPDAPSSLSGEFVDGYAEGGAASSIEQAVQNLRRASHIGAVPTT